MGEPYTALKAIEALLTQEEVYVKAALTLLEPKPVPREEIIKLQLKIVEDWLEKAKNLYNNEQTREAAERLWEALMLLIDTINLARGTPEQNTANPRDVIEEIVAEIKDPEYSTLYTLAEKLYTYHIYPKVFKTRESLEAHWKAALKLAEKLMRYLREKHNVKV